MLLKKKRGVATIFYFLGERGDALLSSRGGRFHFNKKLGTGCVCFVN